ncbi:MAG: hypothetical protein PHQ59_02980 [Candidatus Daviesbacteria bacterium]|nr:hypothetical protein [Candidatus Daviesbacteria bacterium]
MANKELPPIIPDEGPIPVGSIIRAKRQFLGIAIEDFARQIKYNPAYVGQMESGYRNQKPGPVFLAKAANRLNFDSVQQLRETSREQITEWRGGDNVFADIKMPEGDDASILENSENRSGLLRALAWHTQRIDQIINKLKQLEK